MELILAIGIAAIVLGAVTAAFFSAIRLRERTSVMVDEAAPVDHAVATIRKDILCIIGSTTNSVLAGDFKVGDVTTVGMSQNVAIEMYTTTGRVKDTEPWGEIQRVTYSLRAPASPGFYGGKDLVRSVTRNLLATVIPAPEEQWLLADVDKLEFECYDGTRWRTTWDTTLGDTNMPTALRVLIHQSRNRGGDTRTGPPLQLIVPINSTAPNTQMANQVTGS